MTDLIPTSKAVILTQRFFKSNDIHNLQDGLQDWFSHSLTHEDTASINQDDRMVQFDRFKGLSRFLRDLHQCTEIE